MKHISLGLWSEKTDGSEGRYGPGRTISKMGKRLSAWSSGSSSKQVNKDSFCKSPPNERTSGQNCAPSQPFAPNASRPAVLLPPFDAYKHADCQAAAISEIKYKKAETLDFDFLEKVLTTGQIQSEAKALWLGITSRLRGKDPTIFLEPLLGHEVYSRTALVNICAHHAARSIDVREFNSIQTTLRVEADKIAIYTRDHQEDKFARLVQALLVFRACKHEEAIEMLETLYLEHKQYSPAISALAAMYNITGYVATAQDFAREALGLDPKNNQANAILNFYDSISTGAKTKLHIEHLPFQVPARFPESILFEEYSKLDNIL